MGKLTELDGLIYTSLEGLEAYSDDEAQFIERAIEVRCMLFDKINEISLFYGRRILSLHHAVVSDLEDIVKDLFPGNWRGIVTEISMKSRGKVVDILGGGSVSVWKNKSGGFFIDTKNGGMIYLDALEKQDLIQWLKEE